MLVTCTKGEPEGEDCDTATDYCIYEKDTDGDGVQDSLDCAPRDESVAPGTPEVCGDGIDQDCDDLIDEGCSEPEAVAPDSTQSDVADHFEPHPAAPYRGNEKGHVERRIRDQVLLQMHLLTWLACKAGGESADSGPDAPDTDHPDTGLSSSELPSHVSGPFVEAYGCDWAYVVATGEDAVLFLSLPLRAEDRYARTDQSLQGSIGPSDRAFVIDSREPGTVTELTDCDDSVVSHDGLKYELEGDFRLDVVYSHSEPPNECTSPQDNVFYEASLTFTATRARLESGEWIDVSVPFSSVTGFYVGQNYCGG